MDARRRTSLTVAATAACACLALPGLAIAAAENFKGMTPQGSRCGRSLLSQCAVLIRIASGAVRPASNIKWIARCKSGNALTGDTTIHGPVKRRRFHGHGTYIATGLGTASSGARITARETVTIALTISSRHVRGSITARSTVLAGATVIDHCVTGKIHFDTQR